MIRRWWPVSILVCWAFFAICGEMLGITPNQIQLPKILVAPGMDNVLGYDDLGRPLWDRLVAGAQTSFLVAIVVVALSMIIGTTIGAISGYFGGWLDHIIVRIIDIFLAFPGILLAIVLAGLLGPGINNVIIALSAMGWVGFARLARAQVLTIKHRDHIQAAQAMGTRSHQIILKHIIPLIMAPLIVEATFAVAGAVISEAGLSFLGLGVQPPEASWGSIIRDGARYLLVAPHMVFVPGAALMLVVLAVNLLGDRLRDKLDVRARGRKE